MTAAERPTQQNTIDVLTNIRRGELLEELGEAIATAIASVREHGGKATVTANLAIKRASPNDTTVMAVSAGVTSKPSAPKPMDGVLFATGDHRLLIRHDPRQGDMFEPHVVPNEQPEQRAESKEQESTG